METVNVRLDVDQLVLHGLPPGDRLRIAAAVEQELTRSLAGRGLPAALRNAGTRQRIDAGELRLEAGAPAERTGAHIARAVHGGLDR